MSPLIFVKNFTLVFQFETYSCSLKLLLSNLRAHELVLYKIYILL